MELEQHRWRDGVIANIRASCPNPVTVGDELGKQLERYASDSVEYEKWHERRAKRERWLGPVAAGLLVGAIPVGAVTATLAACYAHAATQPMAIPILFSVFVALCTIGIFTLACWAGNSTELSAITFLTNNQGEYLPSVRRKITPDGLRISLATDDGHIYTGTRRIFAAHEETAALEYQVELESIIHDIKQDRIDAYVRAYLPSASTTALPAGEVEQLSFEFTEDDEALRNLQDLIDRQRETISVAR